MVLLTRLEPCPVKGERASSLHSASGSEAVLTCRLLWVPLQFPSLSQLGRNQFGERGHLAGKSHDRRIMEYLKCLETLGRGIGIAALEPLFDHGHQLSQLLELGIFADDI